MFALVGFLWLTECEDGQERYKNVWPARLDMENSVYRPALRGLSYAGAIAARAAETLGAVLIYGVVDLIFLGAKESVTPGRDGEFTAYDEHRQRSSIERSLSGDLLSAVIGIAIIFAFVLAAL